MTGHSGGFGPYIQRALESLDHEVVGFSRSNGYDLSTPKGRHLAFIQANNCDVFINNSCAGGYQSYILTEWLFLFYHHHKKIINISSNLTLIEHPIEAIRNDWVNKKDLNSVHEMFNNTKDDYAKCTSELISWGYWKSHIIAESHPETLTDMTIDEAINDIIGML